MLSFYTAATATMKVALLSLTRWQVIGKENVPKDGALIVVANHLSVVDPPLLSASVTRRIIFMAKDELFRSWGRAFVRAFGAFPVKRGTSNRESLRQAMRILDNGQVLGMFPEGKRSLNYAMDRAELGAALIALRSGAQIIPVGIIGAEHIKGLGVIFHRPRITVTIGKPFHLSKSNDQPTRRQLVDSSDLIMSHIAEVLPPNYRGVYSEGNLEWQKKAIKGR
ncbi:MAG: lysophospholipid acyltransferase family protein [Dehalococcoidia bacterium]